MPDFHTESLYLALQVGLACIAAQGVLTLLFAKVLPDGFWARKPGFLAHQIIALPMMIIVAIIGTRAWFTDSGLATAEARIYDRAPAAETLCAILLGELVLWDIPLTLLPSIYSHASMGHHIGLAALAAICLSPYMQFYAPFFAGVIEISSVPLQVVDFFHPKNYADLLSAHPLLHTLNAIARASFILSFVALRTIWFPIVMFAQVLPRAAPPTRRARIRSAHAATACPLPPLALRIGLCASGATGLPRPLLSAAARGHGEGRYADRRDGIWPLLHCAAIVLVAPALQAGTQSSDGKRATNTILRACTPPLLRRCISGAQGTARQQGHGGAGHDGGGGGRGTAHVRRLHAD